MAQTIDPAEIRPRVLGRAEGRAFFDQQARALMHMSGEEFLRRWDAGDFAASVDDPAQPELLHLAMLIPFGR